MRNDQVWDSLSPTPRWHLKKVWMHIGVGLPQKHACIQSLSAIILVIPFPLFKSLFLLRFWTNSSLSNSEVETVRFIWWGRAMCLVWVIKWKVYFSFTSYRYDKTVLSSRLVAQRSRHNSSLKDQRYIQELVASCFLAENAARRNLQHGSVLLNVMGSRLPAKERSSWSGNLSGFVCTSDQCKTNWWNQWYIYLFFLSTILLLV
jgi:hypothetical protein